MGKGMRRMQKIDDRSAGQHPARNGRAGARRARKCKRNPQIVTVVFFFSSRRRHTRLQGDWSSDVCSSDLVPRGIIRSVWVSGLFGWIMICAILLALPSVREGVDQGADVVHWVIKSALPG